MTPRSPVVFHLNSFESFAIRSVNCPNDSLLQDEFEEFEEPDWAKTLDEMGWRLWHGDVNYLIDLYKPTLFWGFWGSRDVILNRRHQLLVPQKRNSGKKTGMMLVGMMKIRTASNTSLAWHVELERVRLRQDDSFQKRLKEELDKMDVKKWSGICLLTCSFSSTFYIVFFLYIQQFENHLSDSCLRKWYKGFWIQQGAVNQIMCCSLRKAVAGMRALQVGQHPFWCSIDDVSGR